LEGGRYFLFFFPFSEVSLLEMCDIYLSFSFFFGMPAGSNFFFPSFFLSPTSVHVFVCMGLGHDISSCSTICLAGGLALIGGILSDGLRYLLLLVYLVHSCPCRVYTAFARFYVLICAVDNGDITGGDSSEDVCITPIADDRTSPYYYYYFTYLVINRCLPRFSPCFYFILLLLFFCWFIHYVLA